MGVTWHNILLPPRFITYATVYTIYKHLQLRFYKAIWDSLKSRTSNQRAVELILVFYDSTNISHVKPRRKFVSIDDLQTFCEHDFRAYF